MNLPLAPRRQRSTRASTLIVAVFVVTLIAALLGIALEYTSRTAVIGRRGRDVIPAQALAEGALEVAYKRWKTYMIQTGGGNTPSAGELNTGINGGTAIIQPTDIISRVNALPNHGSFTLRQITVTPVDREDNEVSESPLQRTTIANLNATVPVDNHAGWSGKAISFRAKAIVTCDNLPDATGTGYDPGDGKRRLTVTVSRFFQKTTSSLFQAMLFFQHDLELHPGPAMTLYGLVHTNSNLFAAAGPNGSLTFSSNVSYAGDATNPVLADPTDPVARPGTASLTTNNATTGQKESASIDSRGYVDGITKTLATTESGSWSSYNQAQFSDRTNQLSNVTPLDPLGTAADQATTVSNSNTAGGLHEIIERPVPTSATDPNPPGSTLANPAGNIPDPPAYASRRTFNYAGLRILVNRSLATRPVRIYAADTADPNWSSNGSTPRSVEIVPTGNPAPVSGQPDKRNLADLILPAIAPSTGTAAPTSAGGSTGTGDIQDFRELREVNLTSVDLSVLTPVLNSYSAYNGVVYIADTTHADATTGESSGVDAIRLKKGAVLPGSTNGTANASGTEGLTVVSDGAVYVQGDYNTGGTYAPDIAGRSTLVIPPVSDLNVDPTQYTVSGYTQKPAAVAGDAVMILSNNWTDVNGHADKSARVATPTTFNSAILSGSVLTTSTTASGGAHNFPRFLENWGGKNLTYYGSMVELYTSKHWTGTYGHGNVYDAPNRRWYFDNNFLTTAPPGGNLSSVYYSRGRWVRY